MSSLMRLPLLLAVMLTSLAWAVGALAKAPKVSIVTCWPGPEVYELYGHEAIRVQGEQADGEPFDSVFNYGVFDFNAPNFLYRFVKGETDYILAGYEFAYFMPQYISRGSRVVEQTLNLTDAEADRLYAALREEALPENRVYRYNYVKNNCATKVIDRIDAAIGRPVHYGDSARYGTFRKTMKAYDAHYPWYRFGVDLALGSGIDQRISGREEMFAPVELTERAAKATMADGRPLVSETRVLFEGKPDATLPPTGFYLTPMFWALVLLGLTVCICLYDVSRRRVTRWYFAAFYGLAGLAGCLIAYLVFVSEHEATSPNVLIWWLNPVCLIVPALLWVRGSRVVLGVYMCLDFVVVAALMLLWPTQAQEGNPAFFPLMGANALLAATYALNAFRRQQTAPRKTRSRTSASKRKR